MRTFLRRRIPWPALKGNGVDEGQGMVEYAFILLLTTIACIAAVTLLGEEVLALWDDIDRVIISALRRR